MPKKTILNNEEKQHMLIKDNKEIIVYLTDHDGQFYEDIIKVTDPRESFTAAILCPSECLTYIPL